jgi:hypothetical protein
MKRIYLLLTIVLLLVGLTACNEYSVDGYELSQQLIKFEGNTMQLVIDNNYGNMITDLTCSTDNGLNFTLKKEIFCSEKAVKNNFGSVVEIESPNKEDYYTDIANILFYTGNRSDYNNLVNNLKSNNIKETTYTDSKDCKISILKRDNNVYIKREVLK